MLGSIWGRGDGWIDRYWRGILSTNDTHQMDAKFIAKCGPLVLEGMTDVERRKDKNVIGDEYRLEKRKKKAVRESTDRTRARQDSDDAPLSLLVLLRVPPSSASSGTLWCNHGRSKSRKDDSKKSGEQCRSNGMIPVLSGPSQSSQSHV